MRIEWSTEPLWALLIVWGVVNAVNVLQAVGFVSRVRTGGRAVNHRLGYVMIALAIPAVIALLALIRAEAGWLYWIGPAVYVSFVAVLVAVDYVFSIEFRSPPRIEILVPYLLLFFGSILLMGLPMFRISRQLWFATAVTTTGLLTSMVVAMQRGVA